MKIVTINVKKEMRIPETLDECQILDCVDCAYQVCIDTQTTCLQKKMLESLECRHMEVLCENCGDIIKVVDINHKIMQNQRKTHNDGVDIIIQNGGCKNCDT